MTAGRPTCYKPEFARQARKLCALGATDREVADFFEIGTTTLYRWRHEHPAFAAALVTGKEPADERVERALYQRAIGYEYDAVRIFMPAGAEKPLLVPYAVHVPADVGAALHWLRFRRSDRWSNLREPRNAVDLVAQIARGRQRVIEDQAAPGLAGAAG